MSQNPIPSSSSPKPISKTFKAPMTGTLVQWLAEPGGALSSGQCVLILEAMKMEHEISLNEDGQLEKVFFAPGEIVEEGQALFAWMPQARLAGTPILDEVTQPGIQRTGAPAAQPPREPSLTPEFLDKPLRADLQRLNERLAFTLDENRPSAVAKRRERGQRTARENITQLCDEGSFMEYGALTVAAQRSRRSLDDLIANTPADGMITGVATINAQYFGSERSSCAVLAYDATVLAGTQGAMNHDKTDRLLEVALQHQLPVVLFAEGGGGRPGDVDQVMVAGLHITTFSKFASLSGDVPVVGIVSGRCFAGNAALLGCCDVIIATTNSNIGMGGPAMVEGGGLGAFAPEDIGPSEVQCANGVIDCLVADEPAAVELAKRYLSYTQGALATWSTPDQTLLREAVPENRLRSYDVRKLIAGLIDSDSEIELRPAFGRGILTYFARIEGQPVGILANNTVHLGGAIDADAADKAARFMQLCESYRLPIISLVDTPGFMVGPEIEKKAQVRHVSRMFVTAAKLTVPFLSVVLRKGYGLGAMAMAAGGFHSPLFSVAWPTGEFGAMGLEGAVKLGFKKELEAQPEGEARDALQAKLLATYYERGQAVNMATMLEIDAVIDPADTRSWLIRGIRAGMSKRDGHVNGRQNGQVRGEVKGQVSGRRFIDTW
jgi:acetyl-CoA carboxylase carboxyltransferase component